MKIPHLLFAACLFPVLSLRAADHKLTADNTTIKFVGSKKDGKHEGTFKKLDGTLSLNDADVSKSKLEVTIEIDSLTADARMLTSHLKSPDFFDAKRFPQAKFVSTSIKPDSKTKGAYVVSGSLTMHGKSHPVSFPANAVAATDGTTTVTSQFEINRHDWDISYSKGKINDAVKLTLEVILKLK